MPKRKTLEILNQPYYTSYLIFVVWVARHEAHFKVKPIGMRHRLGYRVEIDGGTAGGGWVFRIKGMRGHS